MSVGFFDRFVVIYLIYFTFICCLQKQYVEGMVTLIFYSFFSCGHFFVDSDSPYAYICLVTSDL